MISLHAVYEVLAKVLRYVVLVVLGLCTYFLISLTISQITQMFPLPN